MNATQSWVRCNQVAPANFNRLKSGTGHSKGALRSLSVEWPLRLKTTGCVGKVCRGRTGARAHTWWRCECDIAVGRADGALLRGSGGA